MAVKGGPNQLDVIIKKLESFKERLSAYNNQFIPEKLLSRDEVKFLIE